jgi:hypothetical protein
MKNLYKLLFIIIALLMIACDEDDDKPTNNPDDPPKGDRYNLYVKFINSQSSKYNITSLQYINLGPVTSGMNPQGDWSENLLKANQILKPGEHTFFFVKIPRQYWALCKIGVYDSLSQKTIIINDQPGFADYWIKPTITHWGSDERTVEVSLEYSNYDKMIVPMYWSDVSGINN